MDLFRMERKYYTDISTVGNLLFWGESVPFCQTIELSCRRGDEKGLLAIQPGRYRLLFGIVSPRFGVAYPRLEGVVGRKGILIHPANRAEELDGCIAVGAYSEKRPNWISASRLTYARLMNRIADTLRDAGDKEVFITISGNCAKEVV